MITFSRFFAPTPPKWPVERIDRIRERTDTVCGDRYSTNIKYNVEAGLYMDVLHDIGQVPSLSST